MNESRRPLEQYEIIPWKGEGFHQAFLIKSGRYAGIVFRIAGLKFPEKEPGENEDLTISYQYEILRNDEEMELDGDMIFHNLMGDIAVNTLYETVDDLGGENFLQTLK
jgi:hypothetical protein